MKILKLTLSLAALATLSAFAQQGTLVFPPPPHTNPPPLPRDYVVDPPPPPLGGAAPAKPVYVYEQRPMGGRVAPLVTPEQAQTIINRFKEAYPKLGSPRMLIFVNRELVDEHTGLTLTHRQEHVESALTKTAGSNQTSNVKSASDNTYHVEEKPQPALADKQTVRDVERLFGRPLRAAGVSLTDQRVAAELIADKPVEEFIGTSDSPQARKDREALQKIADTAIEVLISSKNISVPMISGNQTVAIPDIQATAIRLSDAKILGQAASSDVTARVPPSTLAAFDVRDITEATALSLMEDMTTEAK
jgi:hypothetical protein